ncbi:uncharacterized protein [Eleutherodactylus coqui]|uniref:uncharacterized protein n=1 Tax=Eleutherodactylus coqui TaxID=57060 RepID=UPI003462EE3D
MYIDDILILWTDDEISFNRFVDQLNINNLGLRLTSDIQTEEISFLDIKIRKTTDGSLNTTLFRKKTATNNLLSWKSFHPVPLRRGIPKGQFLRIRRNCSNTEDFISESRSLGNRFLQRDYPKDLIDEAFYHARDMNRTELLVPKEKDTSQTIRIIGTYDTGAKSIRDVLQRYWGILRDDEDIRDFITNTPSITFRRGRNLRDRLVHSHLSPRQPETMWLGRKEIKGTFPCGDCSVCESILRSSSFRSAVRNKTFEIRDYINCKSNNVIYMATCTCPKNYIGKTTQQLRRRIQGHLGNINRKEATPLSNHMRSVHQGDISQLKFQGLEKIRSYGRRGDTDKRLLQKETEWIFRLKSVHPQGLNEILSFNCFIK